MRSAYGFGREKARGGPVDGCATRRASGIACAACDAPDAENEIGFRGEALLVCDQCRGRYNKARGEVETVAGLRVQHVDRLPEPTRSRFTPCGGPPLINALGSGNREETSE
jgi:hypothetical protein